MLCQERMHKSRNLIEKALRVFIMGQKGVFMTITASHHRWWTISKLLYKLYSDYSFIYCVQLYIILISGKGLMLCVVALSISPNKQTKNHKYLPTYQTASRINIAGKSGILNIYLLPIPHIKRKKYVQKWVL